MFEGCHVKIVLYGSYARGDYDSESDIDIMILLDIPADSVNKYFDKIVKLSSRLSLENEDCTTVSIIMQDMRTYNKYEAILPFFHNISNEGIVIYTT